MNDSLIKPRPYDSAKDFVPITLTALIPIAFVVNSQLPIATLAAESAAVLTAPDTREALARQGAEVVTSTPDEFKTLVENDIVKWSKVIQETGITAE